MSAEKIKKKKAKTGEKTQKLAEKTTFAPLVPQEEAIVYPPSKLRTCVIGAGAIGGLVAGYLHNTLRKVCLVGKLEQVQVLKTEGLRIEGGKKKLFLSVPAKTRMDEKFDVVIFAVKTQDIKAAIDANRPYLTDAVILTTQNGVRSEKIVAKELGEKNIISSIVMFGSTYIKPGLITYNFESDWIIGRPFGPNDEKVSAIAEEFAPAFSMKVVDNIMAMKWTKLFLNINNCFPALIGKSMQETFGDLEITKLSIILLKECFAVVDDNKIELVDMPGFEVGKFRGLTQMPLDEAAKIFSGIMTNLSKKPLYGSILQSIKRGRPSEIDYINGEFIVISRFGRVGAPLNTKIVNLVREVEKTKRFLSPDELKQKFQWGDMQ